MRVAVAADGKAHTREVVALAQLAEAHGVDELWLTEDYFERGAFAVAGAVLASTSQITVGIGVVNPWTRHPVLTAMETAALAELGEGRVILGLGASNARWMEHQLGMPFKQPLRRLEEAVVTIRDLLSGQHVVRDGITGHVDAQLAFSPRQPVPVALGVKGQRALALAARIGDLVLLSTLSSPAYVRWVREQVGGDLPLAALVAVSCDTDRIAARDHLRPFIAKYLGVHGRHDITRVAGLDDATADAFRAGWITGTPRTDLVDGNMIDTFTLAGDADDVRSGTARLATAGLNTIVVQNQGVATTEAVVAMLQAVRAGAAGQ